METYRRIWFIGIVLAIFGMLILPFIIQHLIEQHIVTSSIFNILGPVMFLLLLVGIILFIYGFLKEEKLISKGIAVEDERTKKITFQAGHYTLLVTFPFLIILVTINSLKILELSLNEIVWLIFIQIGISAVFFRWYLNKKGNV